MSVACEDNRGMSVGCEDTNHGSDKIFLYVYAVKPPQMKITVLSVLCLLFVSFISCKNNNLSTGEHATNLEKLIISHAWKMEKISFLQKNRFYKYTRGAKDNELNFDSDVVTFNGDGTGVYVGDDIRYTLTWKFTGPKHEAIEAVINYATPLKVLLEDFTFKNNRIHYIETYSREGTKSLSSVYRTAL